MKKIIYILFVLAATLGKAQTVCVNGSFEELELHHTSYLTASNSTTLNLSCTVPLEFSMFPYYGNILGVNQFSDQITFVDNDLSTHGGNDPSLHALGINVPRTFIGNYALKLNDDSADYGKASMSITFSEAESTTLSFRYSIVASNPEMIPDEEKPYFKAQVYLDGDAIFDVLCIQINDDDTRFSKVGTGSAELLYTGWQCANFTVPQEILDMNPDIEVQFAISDGLSSGHFATVYLDDLCDLPIDGGCETGDCDYCLYLDAEVAGTDFKKAEYCIEATNTIQNSASALYFAGTEVVLKDGFEALSGSVNRFYIDECSATGFSARNAMAQIEEPVIRPTPIATLQIFPNPANSKLNILSDIGVRSVMMMSLDGKLVLERQPGIDNNKNIRLDVGDLSSGIYILNVETTDGTITTHKIVRE
ncbi:T9SS type A sorting domain-containing protein [uncultured Flavobacterium sp.]|uniref:T9SS type A sorting domain-containing protein n=1 Tax=uncultured Flavobacterium sp. TaxID=165435 RepID=UPI0026002063|nr:T9SS type A sorting domain-containing protein [uncultured Flavobacterium sp.]